MDEHILLRSSVLENRNIPSEVIRLPAGERDPETLLRQLFRLVLSTILYIFSLSFPSIIGTI